jgi:hypothetical protein
VTFTYLGYAVEQRCCRLLLADHDVATLVLAVARRQMVAFAVDSQTTMVDSNEKPFVTPAMLAAWVTFLFSTQDADGVAIAERVSWGHRHSTQLLVIPPRGVPNHQKLLSGVKMLNAAVLHHAVCARL